MSGVVQNLAIASRSSYTQQFIDLDNEIKAVVKPVSKQIGQIEKLTAIADKIKGCVSTAQSHEEFNCANSTLHSLQLAYDTLARNVDPYNLYSLNTALSTTKEIYISSCVGFWKSDLSVEGTIKDKEEIAQKLTRAFTSKITQLEIRKTPVSRLPAFLDYLPFLQALICTDNLLESFPEIFFSRTLTYIDLTGNSLTSLPEVFNCVNLKTLILSRNLFQSFPPQLYSMNVTYLDMTSNLLKEITPEGKTCIAGATFEKHFENGDPDPEVAIKELMPKLAKLYPPLASAKIIRVKSGIRASTHDHHPLLEKIDDRTWVLTGMGSKGLLYHALFAKRLIDYVRPNNR